MANSTQIKITLPNELKMILKAKSDRLGLTMSSYVKNMIISEVKQDEIPVFQMSEKREKIALKAMEDYKAGKTIEITDIDEYFENL